MNRIQWSVVVSSGLLLLGAISAGAAYQVVEGGVADGGSVTGRVVFDGTPPTPAMLTVDEDAEACGGDRPAVDLLVSANGGIQNVVLAIEGVSAGKDWGFSEEFVYDQEQCRFVPHVLLVKPQTSGVVMNSDSIGHNFHSISKGIFNTNKKMNAATEIAVQGNRIRRPGIVRIKCDIHSWMSGWWYVAATPYTVLTDTDGSFSIGDIPAGTYTIKIWHETLGESEQTVVVEPNQATEFNAILSQ